MDKETEALIRVVAHDAAQKAVHDTLIAVGIDPNNPLESQQDFARLRELLDDPEMREDWMAVRGFRKSLDAVKKKSVLSLVGLFITAVAWGVWGFFTGQGPVG